MKKLLLYLTLLLNITCWSQAPNISYTSGTHTYSTNVAISALSPINTGGSVPSISYYGQIIPISVKSGSGIAIDTSGNLYVAVDMSHKINKITPAGVFTTLAGTGVQGGSNNSQSLNNAQFYYPNDVVVDNAGKIYVADTFNNSIRLILTSTGYVSPYSANVGAAGSTDGSSGLNSKFNHPTGLVLDDFGNIYVADSGNNRIRKVSVTNYATCGNLCMFSGPVTTIAGNGSSGSTDGIGSVASFNSPNNLVLDPTGNIFVADTYNNKIRKISPAGVVSTFAGSGIAGSTDGTGTSATFNQPYGLALDASGNMYVADYQNNQIRKITPAGIVTTVTSVCQPTDICIDSSDNIYYSSYCGIGKISVTGYSISPATLPAGLTFDGTTGIISGTPTATSPATTYTIKAFNSSGSSTTTVIIQTFTAPTGSASQTLCAGSKLANIAVVGSNIKWYSNSAGGSSLSSTSLLTNGITYYASQTINGVESFNRLAVTITITTLPPPTTGLTVQSLAGLTISTIQVNTYPYSSNSVRWYASQSDAINHINPLPNTTILVNGNTYYATINNSICESITSLAVLINSNPVIDIDGNAYNIIDVCNQKWTQTNLNVSKYSDGTPIPQVTDPSAWANLYTGAWCYYNNDPANGAIYGKLYNGFAVAGIYDSASFYNPSLRKSLAPNGCHIPSDGEWNSLTSCLGGESIAGGKMKEAGTAHWLSPNTSADNTSRFSGLPGGNRLSQNGSFYGGGDWWTSDFFLIQTGTGPAYNNQTIRRLRYNSAALIKDYSYEFLTMGHSVRLINDLALSTENNNFSKKIVLYPNPTHSVINLSVDNEIILDKITLVDVTGKIVLEQTENLSSINVEKLAKGVYILTAFAGDKKSQEKFIKE